MHGNYVYNKKWRLAHPSTRHAGKKRYYQKTQDAANRREPWSAADVKLIMAEGRPVDSELSEIIGRSVQAIQIKRGRQKKRSA